MTSFQIITIIIAICGLLGGIITVYIKTQVDIARIQTSIMFIQRDLDIKEKSILHLEHNNTQDHKEIINKLDEFIKTYYHVKE